MTDDLAAAMGADRRKFVDRTFETVENMAVARRHNFEGEIVIITANFAFGHGFSP